MMNSTMITQHRGLKHHLSEARSSKNKTSMRVSPKASRYIIIHWSNVHKTLLTQSQRHTDPLFQHLLRKWRRYTHMYTKSMFASIWSHFNKKCCWGWWLCGYSRDETLVTQAWGLQFRSSALPWMLGGRACLLSQHIGGKDGEPLISLARLAKPASSESEGESLLQYITYRTIT